MSKISYWIQASRLPSQLYIFLPLLLGQAVASSINRQFSYWFFILIYLFGLFIQLTIVYANDYADFKTVQFNNTYNMFSGGSRVLVENKNSPRVMIIAIKILVLLNLFLSIFLATYYQRLLAPFFIIISLFLIWAYSYPPLELSYRGGGEFLQMLGVAFLLPLFGYYIQTGNFENFPWSIIIVLLPNHLASAFSTALPDYPSDKQFGKRTAAVIFNPNIIKIAIVTLNFMSIILLLSFNIINNMAGLFLMSLPVLINLSLLFLIKNSPAGSKRLNMFVFFNILQLMFFLIVLTLYLFI